VGIDDIGDGGDETGAVVADDGEHESDHSDSVASMALPPRGFRRTGELVIASLITAGDDAWPGRAAGGSTPRGR
jgi:hypothetical protein